MKTLIATSALLLCLGTVHAQEKNEKQVVRIKKIENINGVKKITDTTFVADESTTSIQAGDQDIQIVSSDKNGKQKMVIINGESVNGDTHGMTVISEQAAIDADIETALIEAGVEAGDKAGYTKKVIIMENDVKTEVDSKDGKKMTKIVILKKCRISDPSAEDTKTIGKSAGVSDNKLAVDKMDFYPNPSNGKFNLKFNLKEKGDTEINVMNMEGKKIYSEKLKAFSGNYDKEIDISSNPKGIYFVKIDQGEHSQLKKLVLE